MSTAVAITPAKTPDERAILTLKMLAIDGVEKAKSGHPGAPMGCAEMAYVLWSKFLRFNPANPEWPDRDRFILSNGHASMLIYGLLHLFGYELPMEELKKFRQLGSKTPGHPEYGLTPGVEVTTGPLGQGFAHGVGMAIAAKMQEARFPRVGDFAPASHRVWGIVSDGDLMEGVASEAASLAGHLKLDNLVYLYDDNDITIDGGTGLAFTEDVAKRFEAYGWFTERIDGHDLGQIERALAAAKDRRGKPTLICAKTVIGRGAPKKAGTAKAHGEPLGVEEMKATKAAYGWPDEPTFLVPDDAKARFAEIVAQKKKVYETWNAGLTEWRKAEPEKANAWYSGLYKPQLPADFDAQLVAAVGDKEAATRVHSGAALQKAAALLPGLVGGSADLQPSNNSKIEGAAVVQAGDFSGRNFHFGVREHGMTSIANGITLHGGFRGYVASFLQFTDYARPAIRLAAFMEVPSIHIYTHDSIFLGEDGPTHQPIEHLSALRAIPRLKVFRPADGLETAMAWAWAISVPKGATLFALTRQKVPLIQRPGGFDRRDVWKGGYVVSDAVGGTPDAILIGTGSELGVVVEAAKKLTASGKKIRVVSMPCQELFDEQPATYRDAVLPRNVKTASVEAGATQSWWKYVGRDGLAIGIDTYGESAPAAELANHFGLTPEKVTAKIEAWLK